MARVFRYYGKKRGNRRTGSPMLAMAGEALSYAVLLALGCGGLVLFITTLVVPAWRANGEFSAALCRVVDRRVAEDKEAGETVFRPKIKITYEVDGVSYSDWHYDIHNTGFAQRADAQAAVDEFGLFDPVKNNLYSVWYNPENPSEAVLVRGYAWWIWLVFTVPISFIVIGAGGLVYSLVHGRRSAERRAAMTQQAQDRDLFAAVGRGDRQFPFVPEGLDITSSPGTRLRFRLPTSRSTGWVLFGALAFCVIWNAGTSVVVVQVVRGWMGGKPEWFLTVLMLPFVAVGVGAIYFLVRQILMAIGVGSTLVEISAHPLHPGGQCRVCLLQSGQLMMNSLRASLVCAETAAYRQGTNTRTETQEVVRVELFRRDGFAIERGEPFEAEFDLEVPGGAMHSFLASHNQICWTLVIDGDVADRPKFRRAFAVVVRPAEGENDR